MSKLTRLIDNIKKKEITIVEMQDLSLEKFDVRTDSDLNINDVFKTIQTGAIVILLLKGKAKNGHYVSVVLDDKNKRISLYDPYGLHIQMLSDLAGNELTNFLFELQQALPSYKLEMNLVRVQKLNDRIATCGRYAILRCFCKKLNNLEFNELLQEPLILKTSDDIASVMTCWYDLMRM